MRLCIIRLVLNSRQKISFSVFNFFYHFFIVKSMYKKYRWTRSFKRLSPSKSFCGDYFNNGFPDKGKFLTEKVCIGITLSFFNYPLPTRMQTKLNGIK